MLFSANSHGRGVGKRKRPPEASGIKTELRRLAFGRDEIRSNQKFDRLFELQISFVDGLAA